MEDDDLAGLGGEFFEGGVEGFGVGFLAEGFALGGVIGGLMDGLVEGLGGGVGARFFEHGEADVADDGHDPGLALGAAEGGECLVGAEVCVLDGILGVVVVVKKPAGEIVRGIEVRQEDLLEIGRTRICHALVMLFEEVYRVRGVFIPGRIFFVGGWNKRGARRV